jgi:hypothetical protein
MAGLHHAHAIVSNGRKSRSVSLIFVYPYLFFEILSTAFWCISTKADKVTKCLILLLSSAIRGKARGVQINYNLTLSATFGFTHLDQALREAFPTPTPSAQWPQRASSV